MSLVAWININLVKSSYQRLVSNSAAHSMTIEVQIREAVVFMSKGAPIILGTCLDMNSTFPASFGPHIYAAEFWVVKTCSMWPVNYYSFTSRVEFILLKVRNGSSIWGVIVDEVGYSR